MNRKPLRTSMPRSSKKRQREDQMSEAAPFQRESYKAPGRLGVPSMELYQDPRLNPRLLETLTKYGMARNRPALSLQTLAAEPSFEELGRAMANTEATSESLYEALPNALPADRYELETKEELKSIIGSDDHSIKLHIFRPALRGGPLPCIVYFHQGDMVYSPTMNKINRRWLQSIAAQGVVAIAVDFRNAWSPSGFNPFPVGLNDCSAAVRWIHSMKNTLNIRNIVLHGHSGGANLALAIALKAKQEGWIVKIDGVYACSPYLSNSYDWSEDRKLSELPSLVECQGYFHDVNFGAYVAHVYTPKSQDVKNPLAWPYHASISDLEGLPSHVLIMDELDPLRDEGVAYYRKLSAAGVKVIGSVNLGHTHCAELIFRQAMEEDSQATIKKIAAFAKSV